MQAIIFCGGEGRRLRPETLLRPKSMMEVMGKPFLEHLILLLRRNGIKHIILGTGYLGSQIRRYFQNGDYWKVDIGYSHRTSMMETGLALRQAEPLLDDEFFVINGDTYLDINYADMLSKWRSSGELALIAVQKREMGNCLIRLDKHTLFSYGRDNLQEQYTDAGVWLMRKEALNYLPEIDISLSICLLPNLIREKQVKVYTIKEKFWDIGTMDKLELFREYMYRRIK